MFNFEAFIKLPLQSGFYVSRFGNNQHWWFCCHPDTNGGEENYLFFGRALSTEK